MKKNSFFLLCVLPRLLSFVIIAGIMKNYVTSAVLEEAPCIDLYVLGLVAKLNTSKGIFIAFYKSTPTSLIRELASMKAGDKVDIFFRFETLQLYVGLDKEQVKCFYDVKIHEGDIKRFKQCLWHEEIPIIARIDMVKAVYGLPLETKKMPRFKNWMKPKKTTKDKITLNDTFSDDAPYLFIALFFAVLVCVGSFFVV